MSLDEIYERVGAQIAAKREAEANSGPRRKLPDRRAEQQPVEHDRRVMDRRQVVDRRLMGRSEPRREDYTSSEAYNKAQDRWAERQR